MNIKFVDLTHQIWQTIEKIVESTNFIDGKPVETFEKSFAKFCNKKYAVGLNSGTDGLKLNIAQLYEEVQKLLEKQK